MSLNIMELMNQAKKMQEEIQKTKDSLQNQIVQSEVGAGMVKVSMNGQYKVKSIEIADELFANNDKKMLEDLIIGAINKASEQVNDLMSNEMSKYSQMLPNISGFSL